MHVIGTINFKNKNVSLKNMSIFTNSFSFCMHTFGYSDICLYIQLCLCSLFEGTFTLCIINHTFCIFWEKKIKIKIKAWSSKNFQSSKVKWMWRKYHGLSIVFAYTTDLLQFSFNWNPRHFKGQKHCQNYARACLDETLVLQELPLCFSSEGRLAKKEF